MMSEYISKAELADMLHVTTRTISNYQRSGALPEPLRVGKKCLWSRQQLLEFLNQQSPSLRA